MSYLCYGLKDGQTESMGVNNVSSDSEDQV